MRIARNCIGEMNIVNPVYLPRWGTGLVAGLVVGALLAGLVVGPVVGAGVELSLRGSGKSKPYSGSIGESERSIQSISRLYRKSSVSRNSGLNLLTSG